MLIQKSDESWLRQWFNDKGGLRKFLKTFEEDSEEIIKELNEELAA